MMLWNYLGEFNNEIVATFKKSLSFRNILELFTGKMIYVWALLQNDGRP